MDNWKLILVQHIPFIGYAFLGALGYIARQMGEVPSDRPWGKKHKGIFLVGVPLGLLTGFSTEVLHLSQQFRALPYAVAYITGTLSISVMELLWNPKNWKRVLEALKK